MWAEEDRCALCILRRYLLRQSVVAQLKFLETHRLFVYWVFVGLQSNVNCNHGVLFATFLLDVLDGVVVLKDHGLFHAFRVNEVCEVCDIAFDFNAAESFEKYEVVDLVSGEGGSWRRGGNLATGYFRIEKEIYLGRLSGTSKMHSGSIVFLRNIKKWKSCTRENGKCELKSSSTVNFGYYLLMLYVCQT